MSDALLRAGYDATYSQGLLVINALEGNSFECVGGLFDKLQAVREWKRERRYRENMLADKIKR